MPTREARARRKNDGTRQHHHHPDHPHEVLPAERDLSFRSGARYLSHFVKPIREFVLAGYKRGRARSQPQDPKSRVDFAVMTHSPILPMRQVAGLKPKDKSGWLSRQLGSIKIT